MLKSWLQAWQIRKEVKEFDKGYAWATKELLAGRESAQSLQLWIKNDACTEFERGVIRAMWDLIAKGEIVDSTLP